MASVLLTKITTELRAEAKERSVGTSGDGGSLGAKAPGRIPLPTSQAMHSGQAPSHSLHSPSGQSTPSAGDGEGAWVEVRQDPALT